MKKRSISTKLAVLMVAVALLQGILFLTVFSINGGFGYLRKNIATSFDNIASSRASSLEHIMLDSWANLDDYTDEIQKTIDQQLTLGNHTIEDLADNRILNNQILDQVSASLIDLLREKSTTEAYLILGGYGEEADAIHCGLRFRDLDPTINGGTEDLMMETGSNSIARKNNITLDSFWTSRFNNSNDYLMQYFSRIRQTAEENPSYSSSELGCWSNLYRWAPNDMQMITYAVPLMSDGTVYGILGISVSVSYLETLLPYQELDQDGYGSYVLASTDTSRQIYAPLLSTGIANIYYSDGAKELVLKNSTEASSLRKDTDTGLLGSVQELNLYRRTSPYRDEKWALIAMEANENLFSVSNQLNVSVALAFIISILIGIFFALIGSYYFGSPIKKMANTLRSMRPEDEIKLPSTRITELDELGNAIMTLNLDVRENASKLSQIIGLMDLPLGVIEYRSSSSSVFCTEKVVTLLSLKPEQYQKGYMKRCYFEDFFQRNELLELLAKSDEIDFCTENMLTQRWVHFKSLVKADRTLIAVTDITQDMYERQKMEYERDYDILTHLLNRRAFKRKVKAILTDSETMKLQNGAMLMWDLDNLKYINDSYGHDFGDQYIQKAAWVFGRLGSVNALVARISGDEFMAFIMNYETKEEILKRMQTITDGLYNTKLIVPDGNEISIRASGGIAWFPDDGGTYEELHRYADFAMYDAKNTAKGAYKEFNHKIFDRDYLLFKGREDLNRLIENKAVEYAFQPIVSAADGQVYAYEALMRPTLETLRSPADVIRLARAQSKLRDIEILTFTQVLAAYQQHKKEIGHRKIFINSIPDQILPSDVLTQLRAEYSEYFRQMVVEMIETEQGDMDLMDYKHQLLEELGALTAIDDFGSGYSSESSLLNLRPSYVKIDLTIVRDIHIDKDRQSLIHNLVSYCKPRNIKVIAEGVETFEEMKTLIQLQVDYLQGYYLGRPCREIREIDSKITHEIIRGH
ncbi:MAG: EAL domain-containing protein [Lachnospiraceae bacterium]|nr:EAL domain-containing protein [Lachnospiraceae bacterium]